MKTRAEFIQIAIDAIDACPPELCEQWVGGMIAESAAGDFFP